MLASPSRTTRATRQRRLRIATVSGVVLGCSLLAAGCSENTPDPIAPEPVVITVAPQSVTLVRGQSDTKQLTASVSGSSNAAVTYTSIVPGVATVSQTGLVTAVSDGATSILVTSQADPSRNASVVVNVVSTIVTTSPSAIFIAEGGATRQLTASVQNNANTAVTWSSSNTAVATVSATGVVTPVARGTANIVATSVGDPSKSGATTVTIDPAPPATATALTSGTGVAVAGGTDSEQVYYISVPAGKTSLTFTLAGGTGDVDVYVKAGRPVNFATDGASAIDCRSEKAGNAETCTITNPTQRIYYITLYGYEAYTGTTMTAAVAP